MPVDPAALAELHGRLTAQLAALTTGEDWLRFLHASRQFHRYSPHNQMLLMLQGAHGHVASYKTWQRIPAQDGGNCQVGKGERGLVVLAPMFRVDVGVDENTGQETAARRVCGFKPVKVFHQGQLVSPPDITTPPLPQLLTGANRHQHVWAAVQSRLEDHGFHVAKVSRSPVETWNGRTDFVASTVEISDHLEAPAALKTLMHEWAHIALGRDARLLGRRDLREVEAESVAFLICASVGVDSAQYSVPYLASWSAGDATLLNDTAQRTLAVTAQMIADLEVELSIDLTPDLITSASTQRPAPVVALDAPQPATTGRRDKVVARHGAPTPTLDQSTGEVRSVMAGLVNEHDRQRLLTVLADLDHQLATALELFADAGFTPDRTARFMLAERGIDADVLIPALIRDELEHHPHRDNLTAADTERVIAETRTVIERVTAQTLDGPAAALQDRVGHGDRELLTRMDLSQPAPLTQATKVLADAGLDCHEARDVLTELNVAAHRIDHALRQPHYNPVTGRLEPLWPADAHHMASHEDPPLATRPPHDVVRRVAATGEPLRLVQLNDAFAVDPAHAIELWSHAGLTPDVIAQAAIASHGGDVAAAVTDLNAHWTGEHVDWERLSAPSPDTAVVSTAEAILREWSRMRPDPTATPEMA